jgi:hypothetical protein
MCIRKVNAVNICKDGTCIGEEVEILVRNGAAWLSCKRISFPTKKDEHHHIRLQLGQVTLSH